MELHSQEYGAEGPVVVLLHGLFGSADNWHAVSLRLAERFHVFALDQRNHGQSPHSAEMNYPAMAADVDAFLNARDVETASIIGHSMGGKTAMQLALQRPERVRRLVVSDVVPRAYAPAHDKILAALRALDLAAFPNRTQMEAALAPDIPNLVIRRFLLKNLGRGTDGRFFWKMNLAALAENYGHLRGPVKGPSPFEKPTLFIRGGKSDFIQPGDETLIHEWFPAARIETIADAGHWVHADRPEEFLKLVEGFLLG